MTVYSPPEPHSWWLVPSQLVSVVGKVSGMNPHYSVAEQIPGAVPVTAVARAPVLRPVNPAMSAKNVPKVIEPSASTPNASTGGGRAPTASDFDLGNDPIAFDIRVPSHNGRGIDTVPVRHGDNRFLDVIIRPRERLARWAVR